MSMHGGKHAAKALKSAGVEVVFTLSGGHIMPLYDGCIDEGIRIVDVRHEQAAVHAADAWARCNPGKIGVAAITAGPGVTDGVTGVANAWRANSPILVFGGQGPFENLRRGSLQEMDHIGVMRPITKYADAVYQTERIPEYIELAIRLNLPNHYRFRQMVVGVHHRFIPTQCPYSLSVHCLSHCIDVSSACLSNSLDPHLEPNIMGFHWIIGSSVLVAYEIMPSVDEIGIRIVFHGHEVVPRRKMSD